MGATPQDEIDKQHTEATELISKLLPCSKASLQGPIPLSFKVRPTCEWASDKHTEIPIWTTRGHVDPSELQDLLREGYNDNNKQKLEKKKNYVAADIKSPTNLWDPINAAVNSVSIFRPSHDAWGINKVVLIFCDDFVQRVFELPWWHKMKHAVQPVLDALHVRADQVVRLLFASLPPHSTIPIHHDTGEWVKFTHRVHLPVIVHNPDKIMFRCGLSQESLERIDCTPGHLFEINNQAKHAVSNCDSDHRVHLILDYVDADETTPLPPRFQLTPGEVLRQTRRSIDRLADRGQRKTPSFFILGAQKAGTTALYEYMTQHPVVIKARRRETHCLDWRWNDQCKSVQEQREWCHKFYFAEELLLHPSCLTGDSTPSYLLDSVRVIPRVKRLFSENDLKFFVMLRGPIARAESHFAMATSPEGTPAQLKARGVEWRSKSFRQVMLDDLNKMQQCGLIPYWDMANGIVDENVFEQFTGSAEEDQAWERYLKEHVPLHTGSYGLISRGLYELNLRPWLSNFGGNQFLMLTIDSLKARGVQETMKSVWKHLQIPNYTIADDSPKNTRQYESSIDTETRTYLQRFFTPHNKRLQVLFTRLAADQIQYVSGWNEKGN